MARATVGGGEIDGGFRSACGAATERRDSAMERRGAACGGGREIGERSRLEKIRFYRGLFAIFCQRGTTWRATSVSETGVARLGPRMEHLTKFNDPCGRFESLGT